MTGHQHHHHQHSTSGDAAVAHERARSAATPDPGRTVVRLELEAREVDWSFTPQSRTRAWGFNGQVPGPVIQRAV
jgi:FtsP/CotA-like multicopper oxidase with cupredoxin domain